MAADFFQLGLGGKLSTRFAARMGRYTGSSSERRVLGGELYKLLLDGGALVLGLDIPGRPQPKLPAMVVERLFSPALGLASPWKVVSCRFRSSRQVLGTRHRLRAWGTLSRPDTGDLCPVHDTVQRSWEHLRFFEHRTTIHARVPRIKTTSGAVKNVEVPWARPNGGFTLLMEAYLLVMAKVLPVAEVSRQTSVSEDRIWQLSAPGSTRRSLKADWSSLNGSEWTNLHAQGSQIRHGFPRNQRQRDHRGRGAAKVARLLFFTPGKDKQTFTEFAAELEDGACRHRRSTKSRWTCPGRWLPEPANISPMLNCVSTALTS